MSEERNYFSNYDVNKFKLPEDRSLVAFWLPLSRSEFVRDSNSENKTSLVKTLSEFFMNRENFDTTKITVYGPERMRDAVNHCGVKNFVKKQSTPYIKIKSKFKGTDFEFIVDPYGFYFFDFMFSDNKGDGQKPNEKGIELLKEILKIRIIDKETKTEIENQICILTPSQQTALEDALVRKDLKFERFQEKIRFAERQEDKGVSTKSGESDLVEFISSIAINPIDFNYDIDQGFQNKEHVNNYNNVYKESSILSQRIYEIAYIKDAISYLKSENNYILSNDSIKNNEEEVLKLILQDKLEVLAIESFLRVATSENYLDGIIKSLKSVREHLVDKLSIMTSNYKSPEGNEPKKDYEWSEENIERYVEFTLSKYPGIKRIDNTLNSSYYAKIGNVTSLSQMGDDETVRRLAHYNEWENSLHYLKMTLDSFKQLLYLYHSKRNNLVLEEIQRQEISTADLEDVRRLSQDQETVSYQLSEQDRSFISLFGIAISFLVAIKIVFDVSPDFSSKDINPFSLVIIAIIFTALSVTVLWCILKLVETLRKIIKGKNIIYTRMNLLEYRSKHSIGNKIDHEPPHDNFCNNVEKLLKEELIPEFLEGDENIGKKSYIVRLDPYKRRIVLRYFTKEKISYQNIRSFKELSNEELVLLGNSLDKKSDCESIEKDCKKIYIKFLAIYSFNLRKEKEEEFQVFKDGIKIYYSIGLKNKKRFKKVIKSLDNFISQDLYNIFIRHLHGVTKNTKI